MEIADTLSKTEMVAKLKQQLKNASEMEQRQAADTVRQKATDDAERARAAKESDLLVISNDQKKEDEKRKHKRKPEPPEESSEPEGEVSKGRIDVKI
jgi:hypothetical protein